MLLKILFMGDIVGKPGRLAIHDLLPDLIEQESLDYVIANAENIAGGSGVTVNLFKKLLSYGVNFVTTGDHVWRRQEIIPLFNENQRIIRPANFPVQSAGNGYSIVEMRNGVKIAVMQLIGRIFMPAVRCPFLVADEILESIHRETNSVIVDMHAEATSEKIAMGWYLDGRVSAVLGSHTHVQTSDERILPKGTAYITDVGMTGPHDGVIGRNREAVLYKFTTHMPMQFTVATGDVQICGVVVTIDSDTGRAEAIKRIRVPQPQPSD
jgi:metallophosphoesterase (TIGR00282 family)